MKVLFDTNIWIRYIIKDNPNQFASVKSLIESNEEGKIQAYCSSIIFLEISYVLKNIYRFKFQEILEVMKAIYSIRRLIILHDTDIDRAFSYFLKYKLKFSDCLIASQIQKDMILVTFDVDFRKIKEINVKTPAELNSMLKN